MRLRIAARKTHKWIALLMGVQVVIWSLSGVYMTIVHIDTIHGDHLVRTPPARFVDLRQLADPLAVASANAATGIRLSWIGDRPVYVASAAAGERSLDARTGAPIRPLDEAAIRAIASRLYAGGHRIASAELITAVPAEIRGRKPPLWRVEFDHWNKPTFYLSPATGELVSRRHELWRIFDFVWMLHIMDYDERENVNNLLLRIFTWGAVLMALSGAWMLFYSFPRKKRKAGR
ncbi:MAG TPA: hypothetical protein VFO45_08350 [Sphingomicrobium sp.]|nr:hypothetical protein [Sphingomicrobium sp.]